MSIPKALDWDSAAALPVAPLSAWYCLCHLAQLRSGEKVLVRAAASGVGDAAVQIAKHLGATVIATAGSDEKVAWALENGADEGIDQRAGGCPREDQRYRRGGRRRGGARHRGGGISARASSWSATAGAWWP